MCCYRAPNDRWRCCCACGVLRERVGTNGRIVFAGGVLPERVGTNGRVVTSGGVVPERCSANSGQMAAGGVHEEHPETNGQVEVGVVLLERLRPNRHVKVASGVVGKRPRTNRHVVIAGSIVSKRIETHGGIVDPHGGVDVVQCVNALSGVAARIAAIRCWWRQERFRCR